MAKLPFGGLGKNIFNPALAARVFLLIAYPVQMTSFPQPTIDGFVDAYSGATPLGAAKGSLIDFASFDVFYSVDHKSAIANVGTLYLFGYYSRRG